MNQIEVVLFDLGNVLVQVDVLNFPRSLGFQNVKELDPVISKMLELQQQYEAGSVSTDEFFHEVGGILQNKFSREELEKAFSTIICEPINGMEALVQNISRKYRTGLVSNTSESHYNESLQKVPALKYLSKHYVSYQLKTLKPSKKFYDIVLKDLKCNPERIIFIDDLATNVEGAVQAGMVGIRFQNPLQLQADLDLRGIRY
jgi:HAD superfamily hydrolase (TIGR01509 family)